MKKRQVPTGFARKRRCQAREPSRKSTCFTKSADFFSKTLEIPCGMCYNFRRGNAPVAQLDRAQASDAWCRRFESCSVRQKPRVAKATRGFCVSSGHENLLKERQERNDLLYTPRVLSALALRGLGSESCSCALAYRAGMRTCPKNAGGKSGNRAHHAFFPPSLCEGLVQDPVRVRQTAVPSFCISGSGENGFSSVRQNPRVAKAARGFCTFYHRTGTPADLPFPTYRHTKC